MNNRWVRAGELQRGDALQQAEVLTASHLPYLPRSGLEVDSTASLDTTVRVYNVEVEDFHTYFVGRQAVWVHNACIPERAEVAGQNAQSKNKELNRPKKSTGILDANTIYNVDGIRYHTDDQGRVMEVTVDDLQLGKRGERQSSYVDQISEMNPRAGDDGGHLIGYQFNGPHEAINFVPMNNRINRNWKDPLPGEPDPPGAWYKMEKKWADALKASPAKKVKVKIEMQYSGSTKRPLGFRVEYEINGIPTVERISN